MQLVYNLNIITFGSDQPLRPFRDIGFNLALPHQSRNILVFRYVVDNSIPHVFHYNRRKPIRSPRASVTAHRTPGHLNAPL